ncbi:MAG: hypothetical protein R3F62_30690 [Planctomycetota bacterium]
MSPIHLKCPRQHGSPATLAIALRAARRCGARGLPPLRGPQAPVPRRAPGHGARGAPPSRINELNSVDERQRIVRSEVRGQDHHRDLPGRGADRRAQRLHRGHGQLHGLRGHRRRAHRARGRPSDALVRGSWSSSRPTSPWPTTSAPTTSGATCPRPETEADTAAELLAVRLSPDRDSWMLWFRDERVTHVHWAGNPHKPAKVGPHGLRLHPRGSFALWKQEVRGKAFPGAPTT